MHIIKKKKTLWILKLLVTRANLPSNSIFLECLEACSHISHSHHQICKIKPIFPFLTAKSRAREATGSEQVSTTAGTHLSLFKVGGFSRSACHHQEPTNLRPLPGTLHSKHALCHRILPGPFSASKTAEWEISQHF